MINICGIDKTYKFEEKNDNAVIIQKCFDIGIDIFYFCYIELLNIIRNCRIYLVKFYININLVVFCVIFIIIINREINVYEKLNLSKGKFLLCINIYFFLIFVKKKWIKIK